jgi:exonuclease SbcD
MKILHLSDIHLGTTTHGKINPVTGCNTRLEDFTKSLATCIDRAVQDRCDLVLFGGDAFPDATPPPLVQQAFAQEFRRLADHCIPTVLLVGNHDQYSQGLGGASLSIYRSLAVPHMIVGDRFQTHRLNLPAGETVQVITIPWLTKSALLTRQETEGLSSEQVERLFQDRLALVLEAEIRQLDPLIPTIVLAHAMVEGAVYGAERMLSAGRGFCIPLSRLTRPEFAYVALGHVHRHQCLADDPPVVYPGSIERVDFGEETETKGYCWIELEAGQKARWQFCPLPARPFCTIRVDARSSDQPQALILAEIKQKLISDSIARLIYQVHASQLSQINDHALHRAMTIAHSYRIHPEIVSDQSQIRVSELSPSTMLDPIHALEQYLNLHDELKNYRVDLIHLAQELVGMPN